MNKIYTLLLLMLFAVVGAGQVWATEYKAEDLKKDDIIQTGDVIDATTKDVYFVESEETAGDAYLDFYNQIINIGTSEPFDTWDLDSSTYFSKYSTFIVVNANYVPDGWGPGFTCVLIVPKDASNETPELVTLELDENTTEPFSADTDATYDEISVIRTLKANVWNTFCMPFSMTKTQLDANLGSDAEIKRFNRLSVDGENFTLSFADIDKNLGTMAGAAYMVRTKQNVDAIVVKNAQTNAADNSNSNTNNGHTVKFCRTLHKQIVPQGSFIISNNLFYLVDSEVYIKGFRGYFTVSGPALSNAKLSFDIDGEYVTEIDGVKVEESYTNIYDLQGRQITNACKGMYIKNGRKVFIK